MAEAILHLAVAVGCGEGDATAEEAVAFIREQVCAEAAVIAGPMQCRFAPFMPNERPAFAEALQTLDIPAGDIAQYLAEWDSLPDPIAIIHFGYPITAATRAQWN